MMFPALMIREVSMHMQVFLNWNYGQVQLQSMVYVLTREKENPHAGKTVLTVASLYGYNYAFCEALCRFNETNPDYFIMADNSYSYWDKSFDGSMDNISDIIFRCASGEKGAIAALPPPSENTTMMTMIGNRPKSAIAIAVLFFLQMHIR